MSPPSIHQLPATEKNIIKLQFLENLLRPAENILN